MKRVIYSKRAKRTPDNNVPPEGSDDPEKNQLPTVSDDPEKKKLKKLRPDPPLERQIVTRYEIPIADVFHNPEELNMLEVTRSFAKEDFDFIKVLAQIDCKFIFAIYEKDKTVIPIMFDQHAVHERLRLEKMIKDLRDSEGNLVSGQLGSVFYKTTIVLTLERIVVFILKVHKKHFESLGFAYEIRSWSQIGIKGVPKVFVDKIWRMLPEEQEPAYHFYLSKLIDEEVNLLIMTTFAYQKMPKFIMHILSSRACKGAIKFGDFVPVKTLNAYLKRLKDCQLPFQCAHGRPTMIPLVKFSSDEITTYSDPEERKKVLMRRLK